MDEIDEVVRSMSAPDLRAVAKTLHLVPNLPRLSLVNAIVSHGRRTDIGSFFSQAAGATEKIIIKRCNISELLLCLVFVAYY